jgi:hypothetical protein
MPELSTIYDYIRANAALLGARILEEFPALHQFDDAVSPRVEDCCEDPFPPKPSRLWAWPNAGERLEPQWWLRNAGREKP